MRLATSAFLQGDGKEVSTALGKLTLVVGDASVESNEKAVSPYAEADGSLYTSSFDSTIRIHNNSQVQTQISLRIVKGID